LVVSREGQVLACLPAGSWVAGVRAYPTENTQKETVGEAMNRGIVHASPGGISKRRAILILFVVLVLSAWLAAVAFKRMSRHTLADAKAAHARGDIEAASRIMDSVLRGQPSNEALVLGARLAIIQRRPDISLQLLRRVTDDGEVQGVDTLVECGKMCGELGRLDDAERYLRMAIVHAPGHREANDRLLDLLRMEGRNWEAHELAANAFPQHRLRREHLELVATLEAVCTDKHKDGEFLAYCESVDPENPLPQLGPIRFLLATQPKGAEMRLAKTALLKAVVTEPELCQAQATLSELLMDTGAYDEFLQWHTNLPTDAERHPTIWMVRGRYLQRHGNTEGAIRCLWEAIKRFPNDRAAHFLIAQLLVSLGRGEDAAPFQQRGDLLLAFDSLLLRGGRSPATLTKMIELLEKLERRWEAIGWCQILLQIESDSRFAQEAIARLEMKLNADGELMPPSANPALAIDLGSYPLPRFPAPRDVASSDAVSSGATALSFRESASDVGVEFRYFIDDQRLQKAVYVFDFAGGGVGVLDYDCDGWPDLYLTQSRHWPAAKDGAEPKNSLFRNLGGRFVDVADLARVGNREFGQGTAVGDYNGDGFPDLYVANLGANVLYLNNGDGTFQDTTQVSGTAGDDFSLSAAFADFSGDGLPDLYAVNYLGGDAMERQCEIDGKRTQCSPLLFPGQPDRLYLNLGNGQFRDVAKQAGIPLPEGAGKGMGLLVADIDGQHGLDVFVTNDTMANRLYLNQGAGTNPVSFVEQGGIAGVAYDGGGRLQGSMGIAAGDINHDGMFDVFVTNFFRERNNLFSQIAQGPSPMFDDLSLDMKLAVPSTDRVGWGAQFFDAELDGDLDLFVANGHLDENTAGPTEAKLFPEMFENLGEARFQRTPTACDYFQTRYFGRAVARLDWNRDGLDDLCVTHMGAPVALLTNASQRRGHFIAIALRGVECSRDAVGAVVEIEAGTRRWSATLMAGGGFCATNQRQILLGLGPQTEVDKLTIRWPQGDPQSFEKLPAGRQWIVIQGHPSPYPQPQ